MPKHPKRSKVERDIDENLRKVYQRMVEQEVPDRFKELLDRLKQSEDDQDPGQNI
ncbi:MULTISPECIES: NepR family anti-sigma factor [unclassified Yoonia]|uniref:NepR family anti-sigma factor n=1 Tax=unclassified Yoonia TaxID=2629118 RepID=UPI00372A1313